MAPLSGACTPLVSVILPTYNRLPYLREAVASVFAQTYPHWELIVVDDGSADGTHQYVAAIPDDRVTLKAEAHEGNPARLRNVGIACARGEYVAFLDSDDLWFPEKLRVQVGYLRARPACRWGYSALVRIDGEGRPLGSHGLAPWRPYEGWILPQLLTLDALVSTPTVMAQRTLLEEACGFDETFVYCADYELWLRLAMRSQTCAVRKPLSCVRNHPNNHSRDRARVHRSWERLYGKMARLLQEDPALRVTCLRRRRSHAITACRLYVEQGRRRDGLGVLRGSFRYAWRVPSWWLAVLKILLQLVLPARAVASLRRARNLAQGR